MSVLVFDIGGTNMRMGCGAGDTVTAFTKIPTPTHPEDAIAALVSYAKEHCTDVTLAAGGIAGIVDHGRVVSSPHLPAWKGFSFASFLADTLSVPVHAENDATLAALGEAVYGAGTAYHTVSYVGVGTGVGGAYVAGKVLPLHARFEPGHHILTIETGETFEQLVSGSALERMHGSPAHALSRTVYDERTPYLAVGLYNTLLYWPCDALILGGSLINEENGYTLSNITAALAHLPGKRIPIPVLVRASLKDESALYGALALSYS